jgi:hypothetical protein
MLSKSKAKVICNLIVDTPFGDTLQLIEDRTGKYQPTPVWKVASAYFVLASHSDGVAFLRSPTLSGVWNTVERPPQWLLRRKVVLK